MRISTISVIVILLASVMIVPVGLSYAQSPTSVISAKTGTNNTLTTPAKTGTNNTLTTPAKTGTNNTLTTSTNATVSQTNDTKSAQKVSDFVHKAVADFKKQGAETRKVMLDCRDRTQSAAPGDISSIKKDCSIQLNAIKAKYQEERIQYHTYVKQYRESVMVFLNDARGMSVGKATLDNAISKLGMMMQGETSHGPMMGKAATLNNTHCVNPPGGPAYC